MLFVVSVVSIVACAMISDDSSAEVTSGTTGDCTWTLDGTKLTISGNGGTGNYGDAPSWATLVKEVVIENGVQSLGDYLFYNCTSLSSITMPDSVTSIGNTFGNCTSLSSITIPDSVTSIGKNAFIGCSSLTSVIFGNNVTSIGEYAFNGCSSLTFVIFGNNVTSIGVGAFYNCRSITSITIPNSVTSIGDYAFENCESLTSIVIGNNVISMGDCAFSRCKAITSITIPDSVTSIGRSAFMECTSLSSIIIGNNVTSLSDMVFMGCTSLTSVTIPDKVSSMGEAAFCGCTSLTSISIPDSVMSLDDSVFVHCSSLSSIKIGSGVTSIGKSAFDYCISLTEISVDSSNSQYCSVNGVLYTKDKTKLIRYPGGNGGDYIIPNSVISIGETAFMGCTYLKSITMPDSVTSIGIGAFALCELFKSIAIPNSVTFIDEMAFYPFEFYESNGVDIIEPTAKNLAGYTFINKSGKMVKQEGAPPSTTTYTVTFRVNGNTIDTVSYENGATTITEPKIPNIKGYDARWPQYTLSGDITVDAILTPKEYNVYYKIDGNDTFTESHKYDSKVTVRNTYDDGKNTYTPWTTNDVIVTNNTFTMIDSDIIFESTSSAVKYAYAVEYIDTNGNEISPQYKGEAAYDSKITPDIPSIEGYVSPTEKITITVTKDPSKNIVIYVYTLMDIEISESDNIYIVKSGGIAIKYTKDVLSDIISKAESEPKVKMTITLGNSMITLDNESL